MKQIQHIILDLKVFISETASLPSNPNHKIISKHYITKYFRDIVEHVLSATTLGGYPLLRGDLAFETYFVSTFPAATCLFTFNVLLAVCSNVFFFTNIN